MKRLALLLVLASTATAAADTKTAAAHYKQGKAFFDAKAYDQAIAEYQQAYAADGKSAHLYNIARAYQLSGDPKHALEYYQKFLAADPDSPIAAQAREYVAAATKEVGDAEAKQREADQAAKHAAEVAEVERVAHNKVVASTAHVRQAEAFAKAGAWSDAGAEYMAAAEADDDPAHLLDAGAAFRKSDPAKARDAYRAYLVKVPLGADSDAARAAVADITRAIDKAEQDARDAKLHQAVVAPPVAVVHAPEEDLPRFEAGAGFAPGIKGYADDPAVLAYRLDIGFRLGATRRVNLGMYAEYASIQANASCGTAIPGPMPSSPFDYGAHDQFKRCEYLMAGLQLYVHVLPRRRLDPYVGLTPGFRGQHVQYTPFDATGKAGSDHDEWMPGIIIGTRAGADYHPLVNYMDWGIGAFVQLDVTAIADENVANGSGKSAKGYVNLFGGLRSSLTF